MDRLPISSIDFLSPLANWKHSSCPRRLMLYNQKVRWNISEQSLTLGKLAEDFIEEYLIQNGISYKKEVSVMHLMDNFRVSGRADFELEDMVIEVKCTGSSATFSKVKNGGVISGHIAQLVMYMQIMGKSKGALATFFAKQHRDTSEIFLNDSFVQNVELKNDLIYINGQEYKMGVRHLAAFINHIKAELGRKTLCSMTKDLSTCTSEFVREFDCPMFVPCCSKFDQQSREEFISVAKSLTPAIYTTKLISGVKERSKCRLKTFKLI